MRIPESIKHSQEKRIYIQIPLIYMVAGSAWIFITDFLAAAYGLQHQEHFYILNAAKGCLFILVTSFILYYILRKNKVDTWHSKKLIAESEDKFRQWFSNAEDGIALFELGEKLRDGRFIEVNEVICAKSGYSKSEMMNESPFRGLRIDVLNQINQIIHHIITRTHITFEWEMTTKDGSKNYYDVRANIFKYKGKQVILVVLRDIQDKKHAEAVVNHLAYNDPLTQLPNINSFRKSVEEAIIHTGKERSIFAVIVIDIDRFKVLNNRMGRIFGDQLIQAVAERLKSCISDCNILARMGGVNFNLLLTNITGVEEVVQTAEAINAAFQNTHTIGEDEIHVSLVVGIAMYPNDGEDYDTLLRSANFAMYRARENGVNYQLYDPAMSKGSLKLFMMEKDLNKALSLNQFELFYQPQINLLNGQITGMEALIRWNHPERGQISPLEFIPLAEETGLIVSIGEWVLRTACLQNKAWQEQGLLSKPVSVNLSMRQLMQQNVDQLVKKVLFDTNLQPQYLELEITETIAMNVDRAIDFLKEFKKLGVRISMDDFGTGYSSLIHLKKFPIDKIKIDRSFVRDIMMDDNDANIVSAIIAMAHQLNLNVIAEGVESLEQLEYLRLQDCDEIQGYYLAKPLPMEQFSELLGRYREKAVLAL